MEHKQANFCKAYGLGKSTVSMAIKRGALVRNTAGFIDDENTVNKIFLAKHRETIADNAASDGGKAQEEAARKIDFSAFDDYEIADHTGLPQHLLGMTIRDLVKKFQGLDGLERYIKMLRDLVSANEKDQKTQERRLQLVEKDFIVARVFQYLDILMKQLLEWPEGNADGIIALVQSSGADARNDVVKIIEKGLADIIKDAKAQITKELAGLKLKYQDDDKLEEMKAVIEEAIRE